MIFTEPLCAEELRLRAADQRECNWQRWGTYLPERQWGTVREDYSQDGNSWKHFPYEMAQYRAYRWGEDGLLGWTDRACRLTFSTALWNGKDSMLKERFFGLTNEEGNHGEDVKELYYYLDATPTHSYAKALYRYPQAAFPYEHLRAENKRRGVQEREYEILDTGVFDEDRFFDVQIEYAKLEVDDVAIRITVTNRGPKPAPLHVLPMLTFRNTWSWPNLDEAGPTPPRLRGVGNGCAESHHESLGDFLLSPVGVSYPRQVLFTENETNLPRMERKIDWPVHTKDAFDRYVVHGENDAISGSSEGTRCALHYELQLAAREERVLYLTLQRTCSDRPRTTLTEADLTRVFEQRIHEADEFYRKCLPAGLTAEKALIARQAYAGLLWSKQFYFFAADQWFSSDDQQSSSTPTRLKRTEGWEHLFCKDVLMVPDKWEYPWFAAWDLAFHAVTMAEIDPAFAQDQLLLLLREWYMHANGQLPAYEFAFGDVNPSVHSWAVMRVYEAQARGKEHGNLDFLERAFQKLLVNFTWWANRVDSSGKKLFGGGFLGLDNISLFNRSTALPDGVSLSQADGNAWIGLFIGSMLEIALELAAFRPAYEDIASMFADDYVKLANALNTLGGEGLWDEDDGFYYDQLSLPDGTKTPLKIRSIVGIAPLFAVCLMKKGRANLRQVENRVKWFLRTSPALQGAITRVPSGQPEMNDFYFTSFVPQDRLVKILIRLLDESEFLSANGVRALSRVYKDDPYEVDIAGHHLTISYAPAEGTDSVFGGNSNWRGPVWFPVNFLLLFALERYDRIFGETLQVEFPTGSGQMLNLQQVVAKLRSRLLDPFLLGPDGSRRLHGNDVRYRTDPLWKDLLLFYEYFSGDDGRGVGASHQTGWTSLVANLIAAH